jgi:hypothetical protein
MKRLLLVIGFALACAGAQAQPANVGPPNAIQCNQVAVANVVSATTTSLVAGVANQRVFVCGWHVTSTQSAANTFTIEYGTQGGPCTSPTVLTPNFVVTSTAPSADHQTFASFQTPTGAQLCVLTTGTTVGTAVFVYFAQF